MRVRVQPRAPGSALAGERAGALVVRLTAAPVGGQANGALVRLLGRALGVPPSSIDIVRGASSRDKLVRVAGVEAEALRRRIEEAMG